MRKQRAKDIQYISEEELGWGGSGDLPSTGIKNWQQAIMMKRIQEH